MIGIFLEQLYISVRLDFFYTRETSAKITEWKVIGSKTYQYCIDYQFELKEKNRILFTGSDCLDREEFEKSKISQNIQIVYLVSDPDINKPIVNTKNIWEYVGNIFLILLFSPLPIIGIYSLVSFLFMKEKINKNKVINSMQPYD